MGDSKRTSACHVVDVIYHPWVIARCKKDPRFRTGVLDLALHWVATERGLTFAKVCAVLLCQACVALPPGT